MKECEQYQVIAKETTRTRSQPGDVRMLQRLSTGQFYGEQIRCRAFSGLVLSETSYQPCSCVPRHCHEHSYFCMIRRGTYREDYGNKHRFCGPFMLAFHPSEEVHTEQFDSDEVRSFNVEITSSWLRFIDDKLPVNQPFDTKNGPLVALMVRLFDEFERPDVSSSLIIEGLTLELLGLCVRENRRTPAIPRWLTRVRDQLTDQCTTSFTLAILAAEAGVQPSHLASAFRRHFGCTIGEFIRRVRVDLACQFLTNSNIPLADIALRTGFADQSHFTRTFKQQIGLTPSAYRKMVNRGTVRSKS
jgi:AraC family transcriptional regulator